MTNTIDDVVRSGLCIGCGVCAYSDAIGQMTYSVTRAQPVPLTTRANRRDPLAFALCPGKGYDIVAEAERRYPAASYDVRLGRVFGHFAAYSTDPEVMRQASSGGVMSGIAIYLLERGIVDRVVTTEFAYGSEPRTVCRLAASRSEVLRAQGSKYCPVDISEAIREIKSSRHRVAIIGTPCQIAGIRNIQRHDPEFASRIVVTIGNFCGGIKSYRNIGLLARRVGIDPSRISFFRFRGEGQPGSMRIDEVSGKSAQFPYPRYVGLNGVSKHLRCHLCVDATGELADIACGDAWLPRFLDDVNPWSVILTRNQAADDLIRDMIRDRVLSSAPITPEEVAFSQRENLQSKKTRQTARRLLYRRLGIRLPAFDGGYSHDRSDLWTELRVFAKHRAKEWFEALHLFPLALRFARGRTFARRSNRGQRFP